MNHLLILPILLPMLAGAVLLAQPQWSWRRQRQWSLWACGLLLPLAFSLLWLASDGELRLYALGDWHAPFGIVLLLDRLSALMLLTTALLALPALIYACRGDDAVSPNFHALFQFQLMGINGAFLTGDLFNLFVFFEVLLIASYALLTHSGNGRRVQAGMHYVIMNLVGSALFLIAISLLYGLTGTLNLADLAQHIAHADAERGPLLGVAGLLLLVVFGLKAAILPLHVWLPAAYSAASGPVAALFAIMTKVGLYAILRVLGLLFGAEAGEQAHLVQGWIWPLAILTLLMGVVGALAARELQRLLAYLVVISAGTLLAGIALGTEQSLAAMLFYLLHSTWIMGGLFLLADIITRQRSMQGKLIAGPAMRQPLLLGALFFAGAASVAGLPPFSGFIGKLLLLQSATGPERFWLWASLLFGGFALLIALSRAGSLVFWRAVSAPVSPVPLYERADRWRLAACIGLLSTSFLLTLLAKPLSDYTTATAQQLRDLPSYLRLLGDKP